MGSDRIVLLSPHLDQDLCFLQSVKDLSIQELVPHPAVERLNVTVLPGTAWFDE